MADDTGNEMPKKQRKKRSVSEAELAIFLRQYGRKAHRGYDPNDRSYDRNVERRVKKMEPEDVDRLMRGDDPESE